MFLPVTIEHDADYEFQQTQPWSVYVLIALCAAVFIGMELRLHELAKEDIYYRFGVVRYQFHLWAFLTCTFLHGGWGHLLGNCYFLYVFGSHMERLFGTWKFLLIYWVGALGSMALHVLTVSPMMVDEPAIGASGAISAVMGAFFVTLPMAKMRCLVLFIVGFRPLIVQIPAFVMLTVWFLGQLIDSLGLIGATPGIAFWAHVGGFVSGAGLGTLLYGMKHRQIKEAELAVRRPLGEAWLDYLTGQPAAAVAKLALSPDVASAENRGTRKLLSGILTATVNQDAESAHAELTVAVRQSKDYGDGTKSLTAYLQMLKLFPAEVIPADIHRSAGFTAMGLKYPGIGVRAFAHALAQGVGAGLPQVCQSLDGCLRHKFQAAELADAVKDMVSIKRFGQEDQELLRRISGAEDELLDLADARLTDYRQWAAGKRFAGCRFVSYSAGDSLGACEVDLPLVEVRIRDALWEGNNVGWNDRDRRLYIKVWYGDPEPAWDQVFQEHAS